LEIPVVRPEGKRDIQAVYVVNEAAFGRPEEANLVNNLRENANPFISLVDEEEGIVVGHIMFTPVKLSGHEELKIMGLAPVAVLPAYQGRGIGSKLVNAGLEQCRRLGYGACVVLGHPTYYPRFGFVLSVKFGITCEYDVGPEVFMVLELQPGYLEEIEGVIRYHAAFSGV
jgi:putative acetyltransferase